MCTKFVGRLCLPLLVMAVACLLVCAPWSHGQEIGNFTGGDPGEGLDLDGEFVYAVNIGAPSDDVWTVNGVDFTSDDATDGFEAIWTNEIRDGSWAQPIYGTSDSDLALEDVMSTILWANTGDGGGDPLDIEMDVQAGTSYKLQMMFTESCCNRAFNVSVEDEIIAEEFAIHENHLEWDGVGNWNIASREDGVLITYEFVANDNTLNIALGGEASWPDHPDNNGHMSALTLEVGGGTALQPGDANMDLKFDQLDLVQVQIAAKYLTGQAATWGEGDWDRAPGGSPGSPPPGDGLFNQLDIIAALNAGKYLTGPYAAIGPVELRVTPRPRSSTTPPTAKWRWTRRQASS